MAERIATAAARKDFAQVVQKSSNGARIKLTRYGKTQAVLIPKHDFALLEDCEGRSEAPPPRKRRPRNHRPAVR